MKFSVYLCPIIQVPPGLSRGAVKFEKSVVAAVFRQNMKNSTVSLYSGLVVWYNMTNLIMCQLQTAPAVHGIG